MMKKLLVVLAGCFLVANLVSGDLDQKYPRNRAFFESEHEVVLPQVKDPLPQLSVLVENGHNAALATPEVLQMGMLATYERSAVIVSGSILNKYFKLLEYKSRSYEELLKRIRSMENEVRMPAKDDQAVKLRSFAVEQQMKQKRLMQNKKELEDQLVSLDRKIKDTSDLQLKRSLLDNFKSIERERNEIVKTLDADIQRLEAEMHDYVKSELGVSIEHKSLYELYDLYINNWEKFLTPQLAEFMYRKLWFNDEAWNVYKHPQVDLYLLIPKNYYQLYPIKEQELKTMRRGLTDALETKEATVLKKHRFVEGLEEIKSIEALRAELDKVWSGWKQYFLGSYLESASLNQNVLIDMIVNFIRPEMLTYFIGNGDNSGSLVAGISPDKLKLMIESSPNLLRYAYFVTTGGRKPRGLEETLKQVKSNSNRALCFGYIADPKVFTYTATEASVLLMRLPILSFNKFFTQTERTIFNKKELRQELGNAINHITPIIGADHVVFEGVPVPVMWNQATEQLEPLLGEHILEVTDVMTRANRDIDMSADTMVVIKTAHVKSRLFSTKSAPILINGTSPDEKIIVVDELVVPVDFSTFLARSIFSTTDAFNKVWRFKRVEANGVEYLDVTISKKFAHENNPQSFYFKQKDGYDYVLKYATWDPTTKTYNIDKEEDCQRDIDAQDSKFLENLYQTWRDTFMWKNTWKRSEQENGAPEHVSNIIKELKGEDVFHDPQPKSTAEVEVQRPMPEVKRVRKKVPPPPPKRLQRATHTTQHSSSVATPGGKKDTGQKALPPVPDSRQGKIKKPLPAIPN